MSEYLRYRIESTPVPNLADHPSRFRVKVNWPQLAAFLLKEIVHYRGNMEVILSRPCVYGVFSGPVGGFAPREQLCVGCLRCTVQYPDMVEIVPNPQRLSLGDSFITPSLVDTIIYEASTGRVPVKGAGYRGAYGGDGWDGMWTDMSEIVRPTRDGIHGREYISTSVDIGWRSQFLELDELGQPVTPEAQNLTLPLPIIFDVPPDPALTRDYLRGLAGAAEVLESLVVLPILEIKKADLAGSEIVPLVRPDQVEDLASLSWSPVMIEVEGAEVDTISRISQILPGSLICLRLPFGQSELAPWVEKGVGIFHLTADYHGQTKEGFVMEAIQHAHESLVEAGLREQVTLIGSGGIAAAEHTPKAIICGLDVVAVETAPLIAVQVKFEGELTTAKQAEISLPKLPAEWVQNRLVNLIASWRDQMLEILGAMGLREVRRLRGEIGRSMRQEQLEREAFAGIEGFGDD